MAQSPEFPEYKWVTPRGWSSGRNGKQPTYIVIHTTEGSAHAGSAEDGAAYDARRTDSVSTHFFVDSDSVVQCVQTKDTAWTAIAANARGIQFELCGRASTSKSGWLTGTYYPKMLDKAAEVAAKVCAKYDIPPRWLTDAELRSGTVKGFTTHAQVTRALGGTHTDPGPNFPFDHFLGLVSARLDTSGKTIKLEDNTDMDNNTVFNVDINADGKLEPKRYAEVIGWLVGKQHEHTRALATLTALVKAQGGLDEGELAAKLAAALPKTSTTVSQADLEAALRNVLGSLA